MYPADVISSATWWRIRSWWHYPEMFVQCVKPDTFWRWDYDSETGKSTFRWSQDYAWGLYQCQKYDLGILHLLWRWIRLSLRHVRGILPRLYYYARWYSGTCCGGDHATGWKLWDWYRHRRTDLCEWLEQKAREAEDQEDPVKSH